MLYTCKTVFENRKWFDVVNDNLGADFQSVSRKKSRTSIFLVYTPNSPTETEKKLKKSMWNTLKNTLCCYNVNVIYVHVHVLHLYEVLKYDTRIAFEWSSDIRETMWFYIVMYIFVFQLNESSVWENISFLRLIQCFIVFFSFFCHRVMVLKTPEISGKGVFIKFSSWIFISSFTVLQWRWSKKIYI